KDVKLYKVFDTSCIVCGVWNNISYSKCWSVANRYRSTGTSNSTVLSGKSFKTKPGKSSILTEFPKDSFEKTLSSYPLSSLNLVFTKFFCSYLVKLHTSVIFG